ncbi:MAG: hypothetical protein OXD42_03205 [Rhodospirillaceae bacterium]|nr:hypothetical protein [Rhodospirillaceae bacterium]MCY4239303.1 hypothetical protein [Rhodospirillaceae bacterium]
MGFTLPEVEVSSGDAGEAPAPGRADGRGLRSVATLRTGGQAWRRGKWIGWRPERPFRRLETVANNTRFPARSGLGVFSNLAARFLAGMTRRLVDD